jgi:hypothetical protein
LEDAAARLCADLTADTWESRLTQVATEVRARRSPSRKDGDIDNPDRLIAPGLSAAAFFWAYLAAIGAIAYIVLYLL